MRKGEILGVEIRNEEMRRRDERKWKDRIGDIEKEWRKISKDIGRD